MIVSFLFEGKAKAEFDSGVSKFKAKAGSLKAVQNERMQVGIRNGEGEIYRAFGITGIDAYLSICKKLTDMGLTDELEDQIQPKGGFDNIFSLQPSVPA